MGLDEPEILVHLAGDLREDVGGIWIRQLLGMADGFTHVLAVTRQGMGKRVHVIVSGRNREGIVRKLTAFGRDF